MPPTYGTYLRAKPRLTVLRGFDPNQPFNKTEAASVATGVTIVSGQQISRVLNGSTNKLEWQLGQHAQAVDPYTFIALEDSSDFDVRSAKSLVGYSPLGNFVLQTGYFDPEAALPVGAPLTFDGTTGDLTLATTGDAVVGYVTQPEQNLLDGGDSGYPQASGVENGDVITYATAWVPELP
jgi:hypothetical protein